MCAQTIRPKEILIVDSSGRPMKCPSDYLTICASSNINLIYESRDKAFSGEARNIALNLASGEIIAFIDVETIPRSNWLETSLDLIERNLADGVVGAINFIAKTKFEKLVRDGFHGELPVNTLPGSLLKREVIVKVGRFIDWVRAGEDTEWLLRLKILKIHILIPPTSLLDYYGLIDIDLKKIIKKWIRNYSACRDLPHLLTQKLLIYVVFYTSIILIAFNWNHLFAEWMTDSPYYINHITK